PGARGLEYTLIDWGENSHKILKEIFSNIGAGTEHPFRLEFQFDELGKKYLRINRSINHSEREQSFKNGLLVLLQSKNLSRYINTLNDYGKIISGFLQEWSGTSSDDVNLHQFDLWVGSSDNPTFVAKANLTQKEVDGLKKSTNGKLFTRYKYSLSDLSQETLLEKVIPSILLSINNVRGNCDPQNIEELLDLSRWKLGVG
ncbi:MAG: hypothetical protein ACE5H1_10785, partial [Thermodesulfobacteriota bacterium]